LGSNGTAEGTLREVGTCDVLSFCISTTSGDGISWVASRDCAYQPAAGESATRFCTGEGNPRREPAPLQDLEVGGLQCSVSDPDESAPSDSPVPGVFEPETPSVEATDLGEPCESSACEPQYSWCWADVDSCDSGKCVGSAEAMYCTRPCANHRDCSDGDTPMKCLLDCNPDLDGSCWDEETFDKIRDTCR
jgi:hypothetical protein